MFGVADNIISKLGLTTDENYLAVKKGMVGGEFCTGRFNLPEPFFASLLNRELIDDEFNTINSNPKYCYTFFEKISILSVHKALQQTAIDVASPDVIFIVSSTKGNVDLLDASNPDLGDDRAYLWKSAQLITSFFGNTNEPVVVSNACISGLCAQIYADTMLRTKRYKTAVVVGAEVLSKFIISGFQSFKALSQERCKPFDAKRQGLNLGEAAATIIYQNDCNGANNSARFVAGAICNDANHISGPSRTGEGLFNAITKAIANVDIDQISFINAHGTATMYNDEMESIAINRAGLHDVPVNSLKAYYGHTLGAAGVLETIISMKALSDSIIVKSLGFESLGTTNQLNVITSNQVSCKNMFIKLLSGFGGSNAVALFSM